VALRSPHDELDELHSKSAEKFARALALIERARLRGDMESVHRQTEALGKRVGLVLATADLMGRRRMILELRAQGVRLPEDEGPTGAQFVSPVVPVEAVAAILTRHPVLALGWKATQEAWALRGFAVARAATVAVSSNVQKAVLRFLRQGVANTPDEAIGAIRSALLQGGQGGPGGYTRAYAETVFRTTTASAYMEGRVSQASRPAVRRVMSGWRYVATRDPDVRDNHKAGDGFVAHMDDGVWGSLLPPNGYNCFPAGTLVQGRVEAGVRAFYAGRIVEVTTENGVVLTVTPNHPIATEDGFVPAGALQKKDKLLSYVSNREGAAGPREKIQEHKAPSPIEDIFAALLERGEIRRLWVVAVDFHGDAASFVGEVHVVGSYGELRNEIPAGLREDAGHPHLVTVAEWLKSCERAVPLPSGGGSALGLVGDMPTARGRPSRVELPFDRAATMTLDFAPLQALRVGPASDLDAGLSESAGENIAADSAFIRELLHAHPGEVAFDKVSKVRQFEWSGHVYDLQCEGGWLVANGIISANCRCAAEMVPTEEMVKLGLSHPDGSLARPVNAPTGFHRDVNF